jgi:putative Ca2+/H+ antiporter (TMEM165/GDT1 family)
MLFAAEKKVGLPVVFAGASLALIAASALGVLAGDALSRIVDQRQMRIVGGVAFILIGVWTLLRASAS